MHVYNMIENITDRYFKKERIDRCRERQRELQKNRKMDKQIGSQHDEFLKTRKF